MRLCLSYKNEMPSFKILVLVCPLAMQLFPSKLLAQDAPPSPPVPVEIMLGHNRLFFQSIVSKPFTPGSRVGLFTIGTFQTGYNNEPDELEMAIPLQVSYKIWKNFGAFAGLAINNKTGIRPVMGPQYVLAKRQILIVLNGRYILSGSNNIEGFALVEYRPVLSKNWRLYSRVQAFYSYNPQGENHDRSFYYLRLGVQRKALSFGPAANFDLYGRDKNFKDNYGVYFNWQFN